MRPLIGRRATIRQTGEAGTITKVIGPCLWVQMDTGYESSGHRRYYQIAPRPKPAARTEFGVSRTFCACSTCQLNCRHMPGYLIPSDLDRMIPPGADPLAWAETHLLASPGALVMKDGQRFRIHTLVPAVRADGSCIHLTAEGRCAIHRVAPFGCAFFDCGPDPRMEAAYAALHAVIEAWLQEPDSLYACIWVHLQERGLEQSPPEVLRERMRQILR